MDDLENAIKIIRLRRAGFTLYEIAESVGLPFRKVRALLHSAIRELELIRTEESEELRQIENERLDHMLLSIWERASGGSIPHITTVLKIMERRAKLLALDLKPELESSGDNSIVIPEWAYKKREEVIEYIQQEEKGELSESVPELREGTDGG